MSTSSVFDYYANASLALASYGLNLKGLIPGNYIIALQKAGMSKAQAEDFASRYAVIDQMEDTPNGASATIFKTGVNYIFAIRGTKGLTDLAANLVDITFKGLAIFQALDIYHYYLRLTASGTGARVYQYSYDGGRGLRSSFIIATGQGELYGKSVTLTGHSLGGHLAAILSRLIPASVNSVYTYNAPGVDPLTNPDPGSEWFFTTLRQLEIDTVGSSSIAANYAIPKMNPLVVPEDTIHILGLVPGVQDKIFSESQGLLPFHGISPMTDSLAVHRLLAALNPGKSTPDILALGLNLIRASANKEIWDSHRNDRNGADRGHPSNSCKTAIDGCPG